MSASRAFSLLSALFVFIVAYSTLFTVNEMQQALVLQFGKPERAITAPGLYFKVPFLQDLRYFDKRILAIDADEQEVTLADQRRLSVTAFARYRITDPVTFYQKVNNKDEAEDRLERLVNSNLLQVFGRTSFQQVLSDERVKLMHDLKELVNQDATGLGIEVVDVRVTRTDLPESNSIAIYRRMSTDREKEAKEARARGAEEAQRVRARAERERTVLLAEARRDAQILRGEGDEKALDIINLAAKQDPEFYRFVLSIDAYKQSLRSSSIILSPESEFFQYLQKGKAGN